MIRCRCMLLAWTIEHCFTSTSPCCNDSLFGHCKLHQRASITAKKPFANCLVFSAAPFTPYFDFSERAMRKPFDILTTTHLFLTSWFLLLHITPVASVSSIVEPGASTTALQCLQTDPSAISLPIHNVTLKNDIVRRGVAVSVGSPPQPLAFNINK